MRALRTFYLLATGVTLAALAAPAAAPLPPNTVLLSDMLRELSAKPGFTEAFLKQLNGGTKKAGAALLTPALMDHLRALILGKDWQHLDHFPGWTMREINPTVRVLGHIAGNDPKVEDKATAGGAPSGKPAALAPGAGTQALTAYLDVGPYALDNGNTIDLTRPSTLPGFNEKSLITSLGEGVTRGDGPNALAPEHAASQRLANVLNRLAINRMDGVQTESAQLDPDHTASSPEELIGDLIAAGNTITVDDARYFANFGHLHYKGRDVMMPFYLNTEIAVPHQHRPLLVPVSHAEYEWHVRGPQLTADVSFYFGIDGKAEWRTMDQLDQAWVMKRNAHTYTGADAVEVTRLNAAMVRAYERLHLAHPQIPFGGYYGFGVCQDEVAAIELKMTGQATLFPNTAEESFFTDSRDEEVNTLIKRLPKDRTGSLPEPERVFGSLPVGSSDAELATITIPGLGADLIAVHDAWTDGTLRRNRAPRSPRVRFALLGVGFVLLAAALLWLRNGRQGSRRLGAEEHG